jgi:hypothetical protein
MLHRQHEALQRQTAEISDSLIDLHREVAMLRNELHFSQGADVLDQEDIVTDSNLSKSFEIQESSMTNHQNMPIVGTTYGSMPTTVHSEQVPQSGKDALARGKRTLDTIDPASEDPEAEEDEFQEFLQTGRFTQYGTVSAKKQHGPHVDWHPVRVKLDSGSQFDLVSEHVLDRIGWTDVKSARRSAHAKGLGNSRVELTREIQLEWSLNKSMKVIATEFYVIANEPFDLLIGHATIEANKLHEEQGAGQVSLFLDVTGRSRAEKSRTKETKISKGKAALASLFPRTTTSPASNINSTVSASSAPTAASTSASTPASSIVTASTTITPTATRPTNPSPGDISNAGPAGSNATASSS